MARDIALNCTGNVVNGRCVKYTGPDINGRDILNGDNLDYVIETLASVEETEVEISTENISANLYCLGGSGTSLCASNIINRSFSYYSAQLDADNAMFSWDMRDIRDGIGAKYPIINTSIIAKGTNFSSSSSSLNASLNLPVSAYPLTVDFKITISTDCGIIELIKHLILHSASQSGTAIMTLIDNTSDTIQDITQDQFNEVVAQEMCLTKDRLLLLEEDNSTSDVQALDVRVTTLEGVDISQTNFSKLNCAGGVQETITLNNYLAELNSRICALESQMITVGNRLSSLQDQINTLSGAV